MASGKYTNTWTAIAIIAVIILIFLYGSRKIIFGLEKFTIDRTRAFTSSIDGMNYKVHPDHNNPMGAANALAIINNNLINIMRYTRNKYKDLPNSEKREAVEKLLRRYNPDNLAENSPKDPAGDTSYSVDKGAMIAICLRDKSDALTMCDMQTLMFVSLHEMSHIAIDDVDHPPRFWSAFKFILEEAVKSGYFQCPDYGKHPVRYCGIDIDYSPIHDRSLKSI